MRIHMPHLGLLVRRPSFMLALVLTVGIAPPRALAGQTDPRLIAAVRMAQDGMGDSARAVAGRLLAAISTTDSLYPQVLYTVALVAASESDRRLYLRRVAVEFSQSPWADQAWLQMAELDYAVGNPGGTVRQVEKLFADYPSSTVRSAAAYWGARAAFDQRNQTQACRWIAEGLAAVGEDVETRNQLEFLNQRCLSPQAPPTPLTPLDTADKTGPDPAPAASLADRPARAAARPPDLRKARPIYRVQIIATPEQRAIDAAVASLKRLGYPTVVVTEKGLKKVRGGAFVSRPEAQAALAKIRAKLGGQPFVIVDP